MEQLWIIMESCGHSFESSPEICSLSRNVHNFLKKCPQAMLACLRLFSCLPKGRPFDQQFPAGGGGAISCGAMVSTSCAASVRGLCAARGRISSFCKTCAASLMLQRFWPSACGAGTPPHSASWPACAGRETAGAPQWRRPIRSERSPRGPNGQRFFRF